MAQIEMKKNTTDKFQSIGRFRAVPINSKFHITLQPSISFSDLEENKKHLIQTIWDEEQKRRNGKLHEGVILSALSYDHKSLHGQFVPYKYYLAQYVNPSLKADLKIVPVALSGMTFMGDDLVIAKRADWVTQFANLYELAPSGGVHLPSGDEGSIDMKQQLLGELQEEIGISEKLVKSVKFFGLLHDTEEDSLELAAEIRLRSSGLILSSSSEYPQVMTVPHSELQSFVKEKEGQISLLSLALLKMRKLII